MAMMRSLAITIMEMAKERKILTVGSLPDYLQEVCLMYCYSRIIETLDNGSSLVEAIGANLNDQQMNDLAQIIQCSL